QAHLIGRLVEQLGQAWPRDAGEEPLYQASEQQISGAERGQAHAVPGGLEGSLGKGEEVGAGEGPGGGQGVGATGEQVSAEGVEGRTQPPGSTHGVVEGGAGRCAESREPGAG